MRRHVLEPTDYRAADSTLIRCAYDSTSEFARRHAVRVRQGVPVRVLTTIGIV